jgi:hypothetical protein
LQRLPLRLPLRPLPLLLLAGARKIPKATLAVLLVEANLAKATTSVIAMAKMRTKERRRTKKRRRSAAKRKRCSNGRASDKVQSLTYMTMLRR